MPFVYNYLDSMVMAVMKNKRKIFRQQKTPTTKAGAYFKIFFNSRTREGCDLIAPHSVIVIIISTHAPARGCDKGGSCFRVTETISTHAPARGATGYIQSWLRVLKFQLTHPRGVRLCLCVSVSLVSISTHAPVWGATNLVLINLQRLRYFNSRTREGCDQEQQIYPLQNTLFQLTHPRGVRHCFWYLQSHLKVFQLTHPRGVRQF